MMPAKRKQIVKDDDEYEQAREKNNEAVRKTRERKRKLEQETAHRVEELRLENEELEKKVETLSKELQFLKDMFVAYISGKKGNVPASVIDSLAEPTTSDHSALRSDHQNGSSSTKHQPKEDPATATTVTALGNVQLPPGFKLQEPVRQEDGKLVFVVSSQDTTTQGTSGLYPAKRPRNR